MSEYQCNFCGKNMSTKYSLNRHKTRCKEKPLETNTNLLEDLVIKIKNIEKIVKNNRKMIKENESTNMQIRKREKDKKLSTLDTCRPNTQNIINYFPKELHPYLEKVDNPLNETEVLISLFSEKNVRIIVRHEKDEFGDMEFVSYYHCADLARNANYSLHHIKNWERWDINFYYYKDLIEQVTQNESLTKNDNHKQVIQNESLTKCVYTNIPDNEKLHSKTRFINEQDLKTILVNINTEEAKEFKKWILRMSTITKKIINKIKNTNEIKYQGLDELLPAPRRQQGYIYIASSPDKINKNLYKIGYTTTNRNKRQGGLQTGDPDIEILKLFKTKDIKLAEKSAHLYLENLHYKKEFFRLSSLNRGIEIIMKIVNHVDDMCNFDNENILLQQKLLLK